MKKKEFSRFGMSLYFIRGSKALFFGGMLAAVLAALLDMVEPKIVQYTVDLVLGDQKVDAAGKVFIRIFDGMEALRHDLFYVALMVAIVGLLAAVFRYLARILNARAAQKLIRRMREHLFAHIMKLPVSWHEQNHTGDIIQRCTSDVETVKNFMSDQMTNMFRIALLIVMAMYFMAGIDLKLALISGIFIPVVVLYSVFFHFKIAGAFKHADEEEGRLSAMAQENLTGVRVVRAFGRELYEKERFESRNADYTKLWVKLMAWLSAFWCSNDLITGLQMLLVTVLGAVACVKGTLSPGGYIAFVSYNGMLIWPVRELGRVISDMSKAGVSLDRICMIMNSEPEEERAEQSSSLSSRAERKVSPPSITFSHVSFAYGDGPEVLKDVSFTVPAGSTLGILGGTGSGKSTLVSLLDRLYEPTKGSISLGGKDIKDMDRLELRSRIGLVLQEPYLFSGTLKENLCMAAPEVSDEEIRAALHTAALEETVDRFTEGLETPVGERGVTLSGGQKQRTAIAQVLLSGREIMIFDDSLSAVDMETDALIRQRLKSGTGESTVILISHRISTLMKADNIIVMDRGRIREQGSHEELLSAGGMYKRIYDIQTEGAL
ncbi:MAG: ABC transporter ATP-binding protein [Lachnospiraceae bacterium]|nr:ABC transporter ATP-binding protein [Lachnospiraceae bacterium]